MLDLWLSALMLAFPSISTGTFGYPIELATKKALQMVRATTSEFSWIIEVICSCFSQNDLVVCEKLL